MYKVDRSITDAIYRWYEDGLSPGSCTEYLLRGNYERAKLSAHMLIRPDSIWNEHIRFVEECVPACCRGENYDDWRGTNNGGLMTFGKKQEGLFRV